MADEARRLEFARRVAEDYPAVTVLVNNAGIQLSSLFAPFLSGKPGAAVVSVSSGLAFAPIAAMSVYCASKAAVHSLSLSMRRQFRDPGIEVYEVAPRAYRGPLKRAPHYLSIRVWKRFTTPTRTYTRPPRT